MSPGSRGRMAMVVRKHGLLYAVAVALAVVTVPVGQTAARGQDLGPLKQQVGDALTAGQLGQATEVARRGLALARAQGDPQEVCAFTTLLGMALHLQGSHREAEPVLRDAVAQWE